jgi:molecular chaperone DnaJ
MSDKRDYYEVLGIPRNATKDQVKKAFRTLARQHHPDVSDHENADEMIKELNEAYEVLSDDQKRAAYDRYGHAAFNGGGGAGFQDFDLGGFADIFEEFFGGAMGGRRRRGSAPRRGADKRVRVNLAFEEAVNGTEKEVVFTRAEMCQTCQGVGAEPGTKPERCSHCNGSGEVRRVQQSILGSFVNVAACPVCNGSGEVITTPCSTCNARKYVQKTVKRMVKIPAGVDSETQIRLTGEGEPGLNGGPPGNLFVLIQVQTHEHFERRGDDILLDIEVNVAQAALGDEIEVPTVQGEASLRIPAGTQSGDVFRLPNKGFPHLQRAGRGDQLVLVHVVTPKNLTEQQRHLFQELAKTMGSELIIPQREKGFFSGLRDALGF